MCYEKDECIDIIQTMNCRESEVGICSSYMTNGSVDVIVLDEVILYQSEFHDRRYIDEDENEHEPIKDYVIRQLDDYIKELKSMKKLLIKGLD